MGSIDSGQDYSPSRPSYYVLRPPKFKAYKYTSDLSTEIINRYGYIAPYRGWVVYGEENNGRVLLTVLKDHWLVLDQLDNVLEVLAPDEFEKKYEGVY